MKKYILLIAATVLTISGLASAQNFYYGTDFEGDELSSSGKTEIGQILKTDTISNQNDETKKDSLLYKIREYFRVTGTAAYDSNTPATDYIKMIINIALGLVSFISLVLVIFAFYLIFFGKGEDSFGKAKKILSGVAIALVIMGLAWIIVTFLFSIYQTEAVKNI